MAFSCHSLVLSDQEWFPSLVSWLSGHFGGVRNSRFAESTVYSFDSWQWLDSSCALGTVLVVGKHRHQGQWGLFPFGAHSLVGERNEKYANCRKAEDAGRDWREFLVGARIWKRKKIGLSWGWAGRILLLMMRLRQWCLSWDPRDEKLPAGGKWWLRSWRGNSTCKGLEAGACLAWWRNWAKGHFDCRMVSRGQGGWGELDALGKGQIMEWLFDFMLDAVGASAWRVDNWGTSWAEACFIKITGCCLKHVWGWSPGWNEVSYTNWK